MQSALRWIIENVTGSLMMVLTATGDYAYRRNDDVLVVPIGCLKDWGFHLNGCYSKMFNGILLHIILQRIKNNYNFVVKADTIVDEIIAISGMNIRRT